MIRISLWTRHQFETAAKARAFAEFLAGQPAPFKLDRFGTSEPARKKLEPATYKTAAKMLVDDGRSGWLFLNGSSRKFSASIRWAEGRLSEWGFFLDEGLTAREHGVDALIAFISNLCRFVPIEFGGAAPDEDWKAKNWLIEEGPHGTSSERVGVELERCLPGIYWLTIFGESVVGFLGRDKVKNSPCARFVDLGEHGCLILVRELPLEGALEERLKEDARVVLELGRQYFFDLARRNEPCRPILGASPPHRAAATGLDSIATNADLEMPSIQKRPGVVQSGKVNLSRYEENAPRDHKLAKLKRRITKSVENDYDDIQGLAGHVVVYLHDEVPGLFDYSRNALVGLDSYFERNPPSTAFKRQFVERELIPAMGAYFGEVLVRQLGGQWLKREPIGLAAVAVKELVIIPFRIAVDVVSSGLSLASVFDAIQAEDR